MKFSRLFIVPLALLIVLMLSAIACGDDDDDDDGGETAAPDAEATVVKVGFTGSLTGPAAEYGSGAADGIRLAFEDAGVVGVDGKSFTFELVALDDTYDPATGTANAQRLVEQEKINVAATQGGTISVATEPIFSEAGIIQFHYGGATAYLGPDKPLAFRTALTYGDAYDVFWPWIRDEYPDIQSVALIHPNDETGQSQGGVEEQAVEDAGLTRTTTEFVARDLTDFYPVLTGLLDGDPDAISFSLPPGQQTAIIRQLDELGYEGQVLAGALSQTVLDELGTVADGVIDPVCVALPATDEGAAIQQRWRDEEGTTPSVSLLDGYLIGTLIVEAVKGAGEVDSQKMADALHEIDLTDTVFGRMAWHEVAGSNNAMVHDVAICKAENGELELLGVAEIPEDYE